MKKINKAGIIILSFLCMCLIGCQGSNENTGSTKMPDTEKDSEKDEIVWAMPIYAEELQNNLKALNELLKSKGFNYTLKYEFIDGIAGEDYLPKLEKAINEGKVDIAFSGYDTPYDLIDKNLYINLNDWINSDSQLYNCFPLECWQTYQYGDKNYIIPNQARLYGSYMIINNEYLGKYKEEIQEKAKSENIMDLTDEYMNKAPDTKIVIKGAIGDVAALANCSTDGYVFYQLDDGAVENPFDNVFFRKYVHWVHEIKNKGLTITEEDVLEGKKTYSMVLFGLNDSNWNNENNSFIMLPFTITNSQSGTAITSNSNMKKEALELLTLLYTDSELANTMLFGKMGEDYTTDGIYAYDMDGAIKTSFLNNMASGIYDNVYKGDGDWFVFDTYNTKKNLMESDFYMKSSLSDFVPHYTSKDVDFNEISTLLAFCVDQEQDAYETTEGNIKFKKSDFSSTEEWLEEAEKYYKLYGGDTWIKEVSSQIKEIKE